MPANDRRKRHPWQQQRPAGFRLDRRWARVRLMSMRFHSFYRILFAVCLLVMASLALPGRWSRLASPGFLLLALTMIVGLGQPGLAERLHSPSRHVYRVLGLTTVAAGLQWSLTPLQQRDSGIPLILLWAIFGVWSSLRLVSNLAAERRVTRPVITGALAGYLMLGLTAGLVCCALETIQPGSFRDGEATAGVGLLSPPSGAGPAQPVWTVSFVRLTYFAFVSLTTVGYGDVVPATPQAQMLGILIATLGTLYVAVVMGLLISRLIAAEAAEP
ncbi:MAG: potassium channel family protein [Synechococcaceae cyanobacterium]